jgi:DNA-binding PadR family transcriptional regulator
LPRVFRRGELKQAIVAVVDALGDAHGYAIMAELRERVGAGWRPSPGAVYPALLALEDLGLLQAVERDGVRIYSLTPEGRKATATGQLDETWATASKRARVAHRQRSVGSLLDEFAASFALRRRLMEKEEAKRVEQVLARAAREIETALTTGGPLG